MTSTEAEAAADAYERGATLQALAEALDVAPATVRAELLRLGVSLRRRGRPAVARGRVRGILPTYGTGPS